MSAKKRPAELRMPLRLLSRTRAVALVALVALLATSVPAWNTTARAEQAPSMTTAEAAHFLEIGTFGPTQLDVGLLQTMGLGAWLDSQFEQAESPMPDGLADGNAVRNQLFLNMTNGTDQLRQRAIFALSQIIVVSANKTGSAAELTPWVRLLSRNAFGNFRTLLREVTVSPTMGKYLDMVYSRKASATSSPNENYARELMQLFTIGLWELNMDGTVKRDGAGQPIPTYTQATIQEVAKALTGWTFPTRPGATPSNSNPEYFVGEMLARVTTHDTTSKRLLNGVVLPANQTTTQDMDAVVDNMFNHPNLPPFIASRLIRSLVTSNPSPAYIQRVANRFVDNGQGVRGDLRMVFHAILTDPEALSFQYDAGRLKDPILHVIGLGRALGATMTNPDGFQFVFSNLSQRVLTSQTVFNFYSLLNPLPGHTDLMGPEFGIYPPALAIQRANFVYGLLNGSYSSSFTLSLAPYQALAGNVPQLVEKVNQQMMFGRMSTELREILTTATNAVPVSNTRERALGALYLSAISSEQSVYSSSANMGASTVQPPTGLVATSVAGNLVTLRWVPPAIGPAPTGYVLEGGVNPGDVLASMPSGSVSPTMTFTAPPGQFYVRIHSVAGAARSRASSEIRIHVEVPSGPTAPANLQGVVKGSQLGLSWRNTFGGGAPTSLVLDVKGALTTTVPIGMGETFSFNGVPAGQYTFSVRALNAAGSSGSSNPITLTFPTNCSGSPQTPTNFIAAIFGRTVSLTWQANTSGAAAMSYQVNVTGSWTGTVPVTGRSIASPLGPGTYTISVRAVNPCGNSAYTAPQTVTVQ
jgi:uncharacterized protein (DUF1800 family)